MNLKVLSSLTDRLKGVIGLDSLDPEDVYVFLDTNEGEGFHMRGVKFPINIAFLDRDFGVLQIDRMEPESGTSKAPNGTIYAVETEDGYFERKGIKVGDCWERLHRMIAYNQ